MNEPKIFKSRIRDVEFGENATVVEPANLYECKIGDDCFIGPFVEIQKGVVIGNRSRIQSHAFVCELVQIGDDCVVAHGVMFINDPYSIGGPAGGNMEMYGPWLEQMAGFMDETRAYLEDRAIPGQAPVEAIAEAVAFLASDASAHCTGVDLPVDGGAHAGGFLPGFNTL